MTNEMSPKYNVHDHTSCRFQKSDTREENKVACVEHIPRQQKSTTRDFVSQDKIRKNSHVALRYQKKFCKYCGSNGEWVI